MSTTSTTFDAVLIRLTRKFSEDIAMDVIATYLSKHPILSDGTIAEHGLGYFVNSAKNRVKEIARTLDSKLTLGGILTEPKSGATQFHRAFLREVTDKASPCLLAWALGEDRGPSSTERVQCHRARKDLRVELGL